MSACQFSMPAILSIQWERERLLRVKVGLTALHYPDREG